MAESSDQRNELQLCTPTYGQFGLLQFSSRHCRLEAERKKLIPGCKARLLCASGRVIAISALLEQPVFPDPAAVYEHLLNFVTIDSDPSQMPSSPTPPAIETAVVDVEIEPGLVRLIKTSPLDVSTKMGFFQPKELTQLLQQFADSQPMASSAWFAPFRFLDDAGSAEHTEYRPFGHTPMAMAARLALQQTRPRIPSKMISRILEHLCHHDVRIYRLWRCVLAFWNRECWYVGIVVTAGIGHNYITLESL